MIRYQYPSIRPIKALEGWIKDQMVADHREISEMYAGPPADRQEALADYAIRRKLLDLHARWHGSCEECRDGYGERQDWPCETVRIIILKWANRPGYTFWASPSHTSPDTSKG